MGILKIDRVHFQTFDSLRFLSFLLVFLHHSPIPANNFLHIFSQAGGIGVAFFFVLSGFLITYILLLEKINNQNKINLRDFFKRRVLRIWPLYYAMVLFAFCSPFILNFLHLPFSNDGYQPNWFFTITFLENYIMMFTNSYPNVAPLRVMWSLCIEEHFYIIWGLIFYFFAIKQIPKILFICIITSIISQYIYQQKNILSLDILTNIGYFSFGAIPAYIFVLKKEYITRAEKIPSIYKYLFSIVVLGIIVVESNFYKLSGISSFILFGALFSVLIFFTLGNKNTFTISDKSILAFLGKYTYGLYLIHTIVIILFNKLANMYQIHWFLETCLSFIFTVILAYLSYHFFEKKFLKLKNQPH